MKRILIFGITDNPGGIESVIMNYYRNIDKEKAQFDFLCNTDIVAYEDEIRQLGGRIYKIAARSKNIKKYKKDIKKFFEEHANEYNNIWVNVCSLANIDYLKYAKKYGIKYRIIHSHSSKNMDSKLRGILHHINKHIIKLYATDFWACSEYAGKWFFDKKIRKSNEYQIINNAINSEMFRYNSGVREIYRNEMNLKGKFVIGNIGRLHFTKNQEFLIDVFNEIVKKHQNSNLLLIGQGEDEAKLIKKVEMLNLTDKVFFLGVRKDINKILQAMDAFVFPSVFEGLPLALIEAQTSGLYIYASKEGLPKEAKIVNNFKFLSLNDKPKLWADEILKNRDKARAEDNQKIIKDAGYDICLECKKIERYFERV